MMQQKTNPTPSGNMPANTSSSAYLVHPKYFLRDKFKYPAGIRLAVNFTIDFDTMLNRRLKNEPAMELSQGEFGGRVGIWRLMDLCDQYDVKLTIFTPGRICELYPESLKEAARRGHEVANHMWEHRIPSDIELEKDHLSRTTSAIEKVCGNKPVGTRSGHKLSLLRDAGYIYTSNNTADDFPYYVVDDEGKSCLLNLPFHYVMDDAMYFHFSWFSSPNAGQRLMSPDKVYEIWLDAFRQYYKMGGYLNICFHAFVSGRSLRIAMIERLIQAMKKMPGVWFPTCGGLAQYCLERYPPPAEKI